MLYSISEYIIPISKATSSFEKLSFYHCQYKGNPKKKKFGYPLSYILGKLIRSYMVDLLSCHFRLYMVMKLCNHWKCSHHYSNRKAFLIYPISQLL